MPGNGFFIVRSPICGFVAVSGMCGEAVASLVFAESLSDCRADGFLRLVCRGATWGGRQVDRVADSVFATRGGELPNGRWGPTGSPHNEPYGLGTAADELPGGDFRRLSAVELQTETEQIPVMFPADSGKPSERQRSPRNFEDGSGRGSVDLRRVAGRSKSRKSYVGYL